MCESLPLIDPQNSARRRGAAMLESLVAIALLTVVLGLAATVGSTMLKHRKHIQQHRITLEAKANLLTFAMAWPYERLSEDILQRLRRKLRKKSALTRIDL